LTVVSGGVKTRAVAAEAVDTVVTNGKSLDAAIAEHEHRVAPEDRALLRMLCYGSLRHHWQLREWIDGLLQRPLQRRDSVIYSLLAVGLLQISDTRIPDHAAVSQTVEAARQLRRPKLAGLVNACLRRFQRENIAADPPTSEEARWNHPQWLIDQTKRDWPDDWQEVLTANNERAPMWLRVNSAMSTSDEYRKELAAADIEAEGIEGIPGALRLAKPCPVDTLPGFNEGRVSVQDGAAQLAAEWLLNGQVRTRVLDACAAPGGKSGHLLEKGGVSLELMALDNDASRVVRIAENLARLGRHATIVTADASKPEEWWDGRPFDGILLDAPCSATGVIRRHPDIKLLRRASDVQSLARLQRDLLEALWSVLAPDGRLLYATCSTLTAENDGVVRQFLKMHDDARETDVLPNNNIRDLMRRKACGYQILPGTAQLDGFYYACLEKKAS
jgi:16S rRNA (cytosine967-C5)-methyltransferase